MQELPVIHLSKPKDDTELASLLNGTLIKYFKDQTVLIRCIGSQDHPDITKNKLVDHIIDTGTDKYDDTRQMVAHDYYKKWNPDLFASKVNVRDKTKIFKEILTDFEHGAIKDRGYSVKIDIIMIYDPQYFKMISNVYAGHSESDLFRFKNDKIKNQSLKGLIIID
jgi:hypothetical protein